jgi:hypothetical protein
LGIHWFDRVTNGAVRTRTGRAETVVDTVQRRKVELFGHICRMNGERLIKTVVTGYGRWQQRERQTSTEMDR